MSASEYGLDRLGCRINLADALIGAECGAGVSFSARDHSQLQYLSV
jgi:hypothetical protein